MRVQTAAGYTRKGRPVFIDRALASPVTHSNLDHFETAKKEGPCPTSETPRGASEVGQSAAQGSSWTYKVLSGRPCKAWVMRGSISCQLPPARPQPMAGWTTGKPVMRAMEAT